MIYIMRNIAAVLVFVAAVSATGCSRENGRQQAESRYQQALAAYEGEIAALNSLRERRTGIEQGNDKIMKEFDDSMAKRAKEFHDQAIAHTKNMADDRRKAYMETAHQMEETLKSECDIG